MKKMILFACLCFPLLFTCCKPEVDAIFTAEYIYKNATVVPINISVRSIYSGDEYDNLQILPGEETRREYSSRGGYILPFYLPELPYNSLVIVDNGSKQVVSKNIQSKEDPLLMERTGLFCMESYELVSESEFYGKRTYRFIFTDDYFKDGEPIENMTE